MGKRKRGRLFIISAPSGCGKTTLCRLLEREMDGIKRSVSLTTRTPRRGEKNKSDYLFVSGAEFRKRIESGKMLEWAVNFGEYYGTPRDRVLKIMNGGHDAILAIDVKGAMKIKTGGHRAVFIFIAPPSISELKKRLKTRKTDKGNQIEKRIRTARRELAYMPRYDYVVVNDNLKKALGILKAIVIAERCRPF